MVRCCDCSFESPIDPGNSTLDDDARKSYEAKHKAFFKSDALAQLILVKSMNDANTGNVTVK